MSAKPKFILDHGKLKQVPSGFKAKYRIPDPSSFFSPVTNLIPGLSSVSGGRVLIGDKSSVQAMTLVNRETPWVHASGKDADKSFVEQFGEHVSVRASAAGKVTKIDEDSIVVKDDHGTSHSHDVHTNYLVGRHSHLHHDPVVKVGDVVKKGQLLATSNFSDEKGNLALGMNLKTAIMPFRSMNFEDALAISESAAAKLEGEQIIPMRLELMNGMKVDKDHYVSLFPNKYYNDQLGHIAANGVVKKGTVLKNGDPVILAYQPKTLKALDIQLGKLSKITKNAFTDASHVWEYVHDGVVTDVAVTGKLVSVMIKTRRPMGHADKLNVPFGAKGVTTIIPDAQMPQGEDGKPVDVLLNPLSLTTRVAPGLVNTIGLGKLAQKLGKPLKMTGFVEGSSVQKVIDQLHKHGVSDTEKLYDPLSGKTIDVLTGPLYFNRLHHIAEDKVSTRSAATSYDANCYDKDTEVLTARGWIFWPDVVAEDLFLTDVSGSLRYVKAAQLFKIKYTGKLQGYRSKYLDWLVTPNHRMYTAPHWKTTSEQHDPTGARKLSFSEMSSLYGKVFYVKQTGSHLDRPNAPVQVVVGAKTFTADDYAEFMGWYLSEGSLNLDEVRKSYKVCIWQKQSANPKEFERISMLLTRMGLSFWIHKNAAGDPLGFVFSGKEMAAHLLTVCGGRYCGDKRIPAELLTTFSRTSLQLLCEALMAGDGSEQLHKGNSATRTKPNIIARYASTSKLLADDIQILFMLLGHTGMVATSLVKPGKTPLANGKVIREAATCTLYTTSLSRERKYALVKPHKNTSYFYEQDYDDYVYCAEIPDAGLLYVRRNGKPLLSGNCQPSKAGADEKAKRLGNLGTNVALTHDAKAVLRDIAVVRATKNDEFWTALKLGQTPPPPKVPFIFNKFVAHLQGSGVNVQQEGSKFHILPTTDKETMNLSNGEITEPLTYRLRNDELVHEADGLFDPSLVGINGDRFNHISLNHKIPNPLVEDSLRKLLGLTKVAFEERVANGTLEKSLNAIDPDKKLAELKTHIASKRKSGRDEAVKSLSFLTMLKNNNLRLQDMLLSKLPVIPAQYRPVVTQGDKVVPADVNELYKDLMLVNQAYGQASKDKDTAPEHLNQARKQLYDGVKAVYGLGDPVNAKSVEKGFKGLLATTLGLQGGSAKTSMFAAKVVNKPLDLVGRGVLLPEAKLDLNQASISHPVAWSIFSPFVIRRLIRQGVPATKAREYLENKHPLAVAALHEEMADRPGIITRDPQVSKFGFQGMYLKLNADENDFSVKMSPLVFASYGADCQVDVTRVQRNSKTYLYNLRDICDISTDTKDVLNVLPIPASEVYTVNKENGELVTVQAAYGVTRRDKETYLVKFKDGSFTFATADKTLFALENGKLRALHTPDAVGESCVFLPTPADQTYAEDPTVTATGQTKRGRQKNWQPVGCDVQLTREFGLFLGMVLGDGWVDSSDMIYLAGSTPDKLLLRARFKEIGLSGLYPYTKSYDCDRRSKGFGGEATLRGKTRLTGSSAAWFSRWLRTHIGEGAFNKQIPSFSLNAPREHLLGLLDGLISTDGCISYGSVNDQWLCGISTSSIHLLTGLQAVCNKLGAVYSVQVGKSEVSGEDAFVFNITPSSLRRLVEEDGFVLTHASKQEKLMKLVAACVQPVPPARSTGPVFKEITAVRKLHRNYDVYDLSVPGAGTFVNAAGLVTYNCDGDQLNIQVPASEDAKEEVKEKLLPSKNLIHNRSFTTAYKPANEAAAGLFMASHEDKKNTPKKYQAAQEVVRDFLAGKLDVGDRVDV